MSDFQSFRNAVLEDEDLQEQVISIVNTAIANGAGLEENIVTLAKNHGYTVTEDDVTQHADFLGQDGDLTDFELEMISGGDRGGRGNCSDIRLKKDIEPLTPVLSTLGKLQGKSYRWKDNNEFDIGLIAQELGKVIRTR